MKKSKELEKLLLSSLRILYNKDDFLIVSRNRSETLSHADRSFFFFRLGAALA